MKRLVGCAAVALVLVGAAGCGSNGPKPVPHSRALPDCARLQQVVGPPILNEPTAAPSNTATESGASIRVCGFREATPSGGGRQFVQIYLMRPNEDPYLGKPLKEWGPAFAKDAGSDCRNGASPDSSLPNGWRCFTALGADAGSTMISGYTNGTFVKLTADMTRPGATGDTIRASTGETADKLARNVLRLL